MDNPIPIFGERVKNQNYQRRPGAYAIALDAQKRVGVVQIPRGHFLPGGGIESDESPQETLIREIREECGYQAIVHDEICQAIQLVDGQEDGCFAKYCTFFQVSFEGVVGQPIEADHQLFWLEPEDAIRKLKHSSQAWAVARALGVQHVACAVIFHEGKLLLGRRSPHSAICANLWDIVGGHVEADESPAQALVREVREELGIVVDKFIELHTLLEPRPHLGGPVAMHFYLVTRWNGKIEMLGDEHTELHWFNLEEACHLQHLAHPEYRRLFHEISSKAPHAQT
jgi:8-oxo-dGTP diphosphatase